MDLLQILPLESAPDIAKVLSGRPVDAAAVIPERCDADRDVQAVVAAPDAETEQTVAERGAAVNMRHGVRIREDQTIIHGFSSERYRVR